MIYTLITQTDNLTFDDIGNANYTKKDADISIILPTFNEAELIKKLITNISLVIEGLNFEIVVVDDDSPDGTSLIIEELTKINSRITLLNRKKRGVFSAQLDGIKISSGKNIILMDADFSHSPAKILEMLNYTKEYDIVSCSRFLKNSRIIAPFSRKYSTILLNIVLRRMLNFGVTDYTSIFLAAKKDSWNKLTFYYDSVWGEAGMEIFKQARLHNLSIREIPFTYNFREEGDSKSDNLFKYAYIYLKRAIDIRFFYKERK